MNYLEIIFAVVVLGLILTPLSRGNDLVFKANKSNYHLNEMTKIAEERLENIKMSKSYETWNASEPSVMPVETDGLYTIEGEYYESEKRLVIIVYLTSDSEKRYRLNDTI